MATWNKKTYRRLQFWRKNLTQCYRSKDKIPQLWKSLYVNCCDFFYTDDFVGRIGIMLLNFTPLRSPDIFYLTMPQEARKGKSWCGTSMRASKRTLQASVLSVHCLQTNEKPRDKMRIHLGRSMTHGRVKLVPHWIPQFYQNFTSSASSKWKWTRNFLAFSSEH